MSKKVLIIKSHATILGIVHEDENVKNAFEEFKRHVKKGKTLYVEGKGPKGGYELLVNYASENGMHIVRLDSKKMINALADAMASFLSLVRKDNIDEDLIETASRNWLGKLRERKWVLVLRAAQNGDIVVMHPVHAYRIAPFLGVDRKKIVWCDRPHAVSLGDYRKSLRISQIKKLKELRSSMREQSKKLKKLK